MKIIICCPECSFEPKQNDRWCCKCGHTWNTFDTGGKCPNCNYQWKVTQCLACHKWSLHIEWYKVIDDDSNGISEKKTKKKPELTSKNDLN